jgi:hypothetical protein
MGIIQNFDTAGSTETNKRIVTDGEGDWQECLFRARILVDEW